MRAVNFGRNSCADEHGGVATARRRWGTSPPCGNWSSAIFALHIQKAEFFAEDRSAICFFF